MDLGRDPGTYTIYFELSGGRQWVEGTRDEEKARWLTVTDGQSVTVDETLLPTGSISGRLVDTKGKAVRDARVTLYEGDESVGDVDTGEDGSYTFSQVFPGTYAIRFAPRKGPAQWANGKSTRSTATPIKVVADQVTTVDEKLLVLGTVAGKFTTLAGKPIAKASVTVSPANDEDYDGDNEFPAKTDANGKYTVKGVLPGTYVVSFTDRTGRAQYAYGSGNRAGASTVTVRSGATTTVNDKQVAPATLRVTAVDATSGKQLRSFCVDVDTAGGDHCTTKSVVVVKNLPADSLRVSVNPPSSSLYLDRRDLLARTQAGKTTKLTAKLQLGGAISTHAVARDTAKPARGTCFAAIVPGRGGLPDGATNCTNAKGDSRTYPLAPGTYNMFVYAGGSYGHQWLGASGGTGDQRAAAKITVRAGKVTAAPKVKLDKAGKISGSVTTADGEPVRNGHAGISAWNFHAGASGGSAINRLGQYTLDDLGPYKWPLVFTTRQSRQWSGGKGNRYDAATVQVVAGKTVTHDEVIQEQSKVTGTVRMTADKLKDGYVTAYTASTGDQIGSGWFQADGAYTMLVPGGEKVKFEYEIETQTSGDLQGWYDHAPTYETATLVDVPTNGSKTVDITVD